MSESTTLPLSILYDFSPIEEKLDLKWFDFRTNEVILQSRQKEIDDLCKPGARVLMIFGPVRARARA